MLKQRSLASLEKGIVYVSIASIFVALFGLFVKLGMGISSIPLLVFLRFFIPFLLIIPWIMYKGGKKIFITQSNLKDQIVRSSFEVFVQFCLFYYLANGSLLNGVMLWNTGPLFIPILSLVLFKQHVSKITWFSIFVGLVGVICIIKPTNGIIDNLSIYGILAGVGMGVSQVIYGLTVHRYKTIENLFYLYGVSSFLSGIVLFVSAFFIHEELIRACKQCFGYGWLELSYTLMLSICSIISQTLRGVAYKHAKPVSLAPFLYFSVVIAGFLDWLVFDRSPNFLSIVGSLLIILASFLKWTFTINNKNTAAPLE
ncbi:MAG: DMT family transporter [Chlamydiales bacterium]|nr:DMT family transporter [Chlamydiales bacterium]